MLRKPQNVGFLPIRPTFLGNESFILQKSIHQISDDRMAKRFRYMMIIVIIIMITFGNFTAIAQPGHPGGEEETETITIKGYSNVDQSVEEIIEFGDVTISKVEFVLSWEDDEGSNSDPDTLSLFTSDGMHEPKSKEGSGGSVAITWDEDRLNDTWTAVITCESAGPTEEPVGPLGLITQQVADPGNSWMLEVTYTYSGGSGGPPPEVARMLQVIQTPQFKVHVALMIASIFLFLGTGLFAFAFLFIRIKGPDQNAWAPMLKKLFATPFFLILLAIITFIAFFLAAVPFGMWVASDMYGPAKMWTGFPALWNPEAFEMTNADNVSFVVLLFWFVPLYINRAQIMRSKYFKKLFGRSKFAMKRAEKAPDPMIPNSILALCYFLLGIMTFVIFEVQPHGSG